MAGDCPLWVESGHPVSNRSYRPKADDAAPLAVRLAAMTRRSKQTALAAFALCLAIAFAMIGTGMPLRWAKGVVLPGSCTRVAEAHVCQVELVPDGTPVSAQSDVAVAAGSWVKLRVWRNLVSGTDTYTVVP